MTDPLDIYPMPSFVHLEVADIAVSATFYGALGFREVFSLPGPGGGPMMVHLRWTNYADLLLRPARAVREGPAGLGVDLTYTVFEGTVDQVADRARAIDAMLVSEPGDRPWNARDFSVLDPDGFRLTFTKGPVNADLSFEEVTGNAGGS